mmetsp:Transcript_14413/g.16370  ORF Transcript_14413/g.16370 Transcript_14413/m.16370 type:complete len:360 (-) Transcript_14413:2783-3862(-)
MSVPRKRKTEDLTSLPRCKQTGCGFLVLKRTEFCRIHTIWDRESGPPRVNENGKKICALKQCSNLAQRKSDLCKTHNRFKLCEFRDCPKRALRYDKFCSEHGGGKRCSVEGCNNIVRSKGRCIGHGGGKRCKVANCPNSAVGSTGVCKAHGAAKKLKESRPEQNPVMTLPPKSLPIMERLRIITAQRALEKEKESICRERGCQKLVQEGSRFCDTHIAKRSRACLGKRKQASIAAAGSAEQTSVKKCKMEGCNGQATLKNLLCLKHTRAKPCKYKLCKKRAMRFGNFCSEHCSATDDQPQNEAVSASESDDSTSSHHSDCGNDSKDTDINCATRVFSKNFYTDKKEESLSVTSRAIFSC